MSSVNSSSSSATLSNRSCKPIKCGPLTFQCACLAWRPRSSTSARCWLSRSIDLRRIGSRRLFWVLCRVGFISSGVILEAGLNYSTIHPEGGTVGRGGQWAAHVSHQIGHLFGRREPLQERRRTYRLEKLLFKFCKRFAAAKLSRNFLHTGGMGWTGQHRIHRDSCAGTQLGKAARNSKLRGLRHAVMDHLGGGIDRALAADENDAPPVPLLHAGQIRTTQAHAAEHVDLEEPPPFLVGNSLKRLWLENAEVVHENVHEREPLEQRFCRRRCGEITREAFNPGIRHGLFNLSLRLCDRFLRATVHDDSRAFAGQPGGNGKSNSFGRGRNKGCLVS